jgi:hypothetical protein
MLTNESECYSFMVPQESCLSMFPGHNISKQVIPPPYLITVEKNSYRPLERIKGANIIVFLFYKSI